MLRGLAYALRRFVPRMAGALRGSSGQGCFG